MTNLLPAAISLNLEYEREHLRDCIRGLKPCDWQITGGSIVNVLTGEIYPADIWLAHGWIVHVTQPGDQEPYPFREELKTKQVYQADGKLVLPGFVDAHIHIESTMLTPYLLGQVLALRGTTTILHDPHEICNVAGDNGFRFMSQSASDSPIRQYPLVPSCIPAVPSLESAGADWDETDIEKIFDDIDNPTVLAGLAEVMDYLGVIYGNERMEAIVQVALDNEAFIQGHILGARGRSLSAYLLSGAASNHENLTTEDVITALRAGLHVDLRLTSSLVHDELAQLLAGIELDRYRDLVSLCTDDVHIGDILSRGHLNYSVKLLVEAGVELATAVRMASLNTWREYGVKQMGAIAPGYGADLQILAGKEETLGQLPVAVFVAGELVARDGQLLNEPKKNRRTLEFEHYNTVDLPRIKAKDLLVESQYHNTNAVLVNVMDASQGIQFRLDTVKIPVVDGYLSLEGQPNLAWVFVFNRYGDNNLGVGIVKDYPLVKGAIASTVSHDSHNLTVVFRNRDLAAKAINHLIQSHGGIVYFTDEGDLTAVPLSVGGLMSNAHPKHVALEVEALDRVYRQHNGAQANFTAIVTLALPVIPQVRMTDVYGLVNTVTQEPLALEIEPAD
jgi:adenine deaminase